jgi:hypothetical protein
MLFTLANLFKSFFRKPRAMNTDNLQNLVDSTISMDTDFFLTQLMLVAVLSPDSPEKILRRFMVESVTHCKDPFTTPQHEFLIIGLSDTYQSGSKTHLLYLERTVSDIHPPTSSFADHPDNTPIHQSIVETLEEIVASLMPKVSQPYEAIIDESEATADSYSHIYSCFDSASLFSTKSVFTSTRSISKVYKADDRFSGGGNAGLYAEASHNVRQLDFKSQSLSLFDLAVLANAVHIHAPLYSILGNHCFWFSNIICDVLEQEYPPTCMTFVFLVMTICRTWRADG